MFAVKRTLRPLTAGLVVALVALAAATAFADEAADAEARKAKILANLKVTYPQLQSLDVVMGAIEPSGFAGLDQGTFVVNGQQTQFYLVSNDDKKLYLVAAEPIDVSRSQEEIEAELARQAEEAVKEAAGRRDELAAAAAALPHRGNAEASVTIVEFSDFQCPFCARGATTVEQILQKHGDDVKFVFMHFPLGMHPWARPAAIAAQCAANQSQDAFWALHDRYFEAQREINPDNVMAKTKEFLGDTGIDLTQWATCAEDDSSPAHTEAAAAVDAQMALGQKMGISGTPGFFVNGQLLSGAQPLAAFEPLIEAAKQGA